MTPSPCGSCSRTRAASTALRRCGPTRWRTSPRCSGRFSAAPARAASSLTATAATQCSGSSSPTSPEPRSRRRQPGSSSNRSAWPTLVPDAGPGLAGRRVRLPAHAGRFVRARADPMFALQSAGGLWSTGPDLVRFGSGWRTLLPGELAEQALRPHARSMTQLRRSGSAGCCSARWSRRPQRGRAGFVGLADHPSEHGPRQRCADQPAGPRRAGERHAAPLGRLSTARPATRAIPPTRPTVGPVPSQGQHPRRKVVKIIFGKLLVRLHASDCWTCCRWSSQVLLAWRQRRAMMAPVRGQTRAAVQMPVPSGSLRPAPAPRKAPSAGTQVPPAHQACRAHRRLV